MPPRAWVRSDGVVQLGPDEGLLIIDVDSKFWISRLFFGPYKIHNVPGRGQLRIAIVKTGIYSWLRAEIDTSPRTYRIYPLDWVERSEFRVEPGQINYPGKLVIRREQGDRFTARVVNRSAEALKALQGHFPILLGSRPLRYSGFIRDDFLPEYFESEGLRSKAGGL